MSVESKPDMESGSESGAASPVIHETAQSLSLSSSLSTPSVAENGPPSLGYSLYAKHRIRNIFIFWSLVVFDSVAMPIILYFLLWYHTSLSPNAVFSIVTAAIGGVSIVDYGWRLWKLVKRDSDCRVPGFRRRDLDFFHWCFTLMWLILMVELIVGTCPRNPPIRLLSMPLASALYTFGIILGAIDIMRWRRVPSPCRISSQEKGAIPRPAIYFIIEDVVAVDGCGTVAFRTALNTRYEASLLFRIMLARLSAFWWISALAVAILTTVLVFQLPHDAAFVVGWSVPFVWAGIWAGVTILYVRSQLRREKETWSKVEEVRP